MSQARGFEFRLVLPQNHENAILLHTTTLTDLRLSGNRSAEMLEIASNLAVQT
jgi:hypothetical protein